MSARDGFYRLAVIYVHRWWVVIIAPVSMFIYLQLKHRPPEVDPAMWNLLGASLSTVLTVSALIIVWWVIAGFLKPEPKVEPAEAPPREASKSSPWS